MIVQVLKMNSKVLLLSFILVFLFSCSASPRYTHSKKTSPSPSTSTSTSPSASALSSPLTLSSGSKLIPVTKNPTLSYKQSWTGIASWYGEKFHGKLTANGEIYDMYSMTAAHKTLPLGTVVKVSNLDNKKSVKVRINDRGPYIEGRLIDLSFAAAKKLGYENLGTANVRLQVIKFGDNSYKKK